MVQRCNAVTGASCRGEEDKLAIKTKAGGQAKAEAEATAAQTEAEATAAQAEATAAHLGPGASGPVSLSTALWLQMIRNGKKMHEKSWADYNRAIMTDYTRIYKILSQDLYNHLHGFYKVR